MSLSSVGSKKTCDQCEARFYDLNQDPATCPMCQAVQKPPKIATRRRGRRDSTDAPDAAMNLAPTRAGVKWR